MSVLAALMLSAALQPQVFATSTHFHCDYTIMGAPFVALDFDVLANGDVSKSVTVNHYGSAHQETFVRVASTAPDQALHAWISKESKDNQIEFVLYSAAKAQGNSEIINNQMPMGKEVWGQCNPANLSEK